MLQEFGEGIWVVAGPVVDGMAGFQFPTRMAVMRLSGGDLAVWSPILLTDALRDQVLALGPVAHIIAPNTLHHMFVGKWRTAFPKAVVHGAPGLDVKRPDLVLDHVLSDAPTPALRGDLEQVVLDAHRITTEVVLFHRPSGTVLFTDMMQQFPQGWFSGWRALVARLDLMVGAEPAVPRKFRMGFKDRARARTQVACILGWPAQRVLMAHGTPVEQDAQGFLRRAFAWLIKTDLT